jgi:anti-sigma factor RsiW
MNPNVPVEAWELSGLLDGELSPERAAEVRAEIESDPALREQWKILTRLDLQWSDSAVSADLAVRVSLPIVRWPLAASVLVGMLLLAVRFVPKFIAPTVGLILQSAVLALLLTCAVVLVNKAESGMGVRTASPRPSSRPA